ncbi:MAG: DUF2610 domain-containing protein [Rickettsiaceae bacterium]|nr:DUF2610 domain-containing protein [Rickettsiaceae bacterium]
MKKFVVNCDFGGQPSPFSLYIGNPESSKHPIQSQASWLGQSRGGNVPNEFMDAISRLKDIADKNNVLLEDLCVYAIGFAQQEASGDMDESEETDEAGESDESMDLVLEDEDFESLEEDEKDYTNN